MFRIRAFFAFWLFAKMADSHISRAYLSLRNF